MDFQKEWERCAPWLAAALARGSGTHTLDDVRDAIECGDMQFWAGERSAIVTVVDVYPQLKALTVFLAGGDLGELREMQRSLEAFARAWGCMRLQGVGRRGWSRAMDGFRETAAVAIKEL